MNEAFANLLTARLTELTSDLRFYYKPDGSMIAPRIVQTRVPSKDQDYQEGGEFPLVRWAFHECSFDGRRPAPFSVPLAAWIYTSGDIAMGTSEIMSLVMALGTIVNKRSFPPYRLITPVNFIVGSPERGSEGDQPHPYYGATTKLQFLVP